MIYTTYDPATGGITGSGVGDTKNLGSGLRWIEGRWDGMLYYVEDRKPVLYPARPSSNYWVVYIWDLPTKTWSVNEKQSAINVKKIRDDKLIAVDRINPIWWASMTPLQQAQATEYRQALLDVTRQPGYPVDVTWPVKPVWL